MTTPQEHRQRVARMGQYAEYVREEHGDGLEIQLPLDEHAGETTAADASGNGHDGTYQGVWAMQAPSLVRGLRGCPRSDGATAYVEVSSDTGLVPGTGDYTYAAWWYYEVGSDASYALDMAGSGRAFLRHASGTFRFRATDTEGDFASAQVDLDSSGTYLHVGRIDTSSDTITCWVNGVSETVQGTAIEDVSPTGSMYIGRFSGSSAEFLPDRIQHVMGWSRALPDDELDALYRRGRGLL